MSFEVRRGESLGIIGRNGAGKSTLLKILSRITEPTAGHVDLTGRVASLLEVGTGFHPDLTGEENIYLNGAILGMTRREVRRRFDEIAAFAGVEKFLRTAVKHYSSGMYTRLAFAVAAHLESEILIVDEVLAVGDAEFQRRCLDRMGDITGSGRTILFVSHNLAAVTRLCDRAVLLEGGRLVGEGATDAVVGEYLQHAHGRATSGLAERTDRRGDGAVRFHAVRCLGPPGLEGGGQTMIGGRPGSFELDYVSANPQPVGDLRVAVTVLDAHGMKLLTCSTRFEHGPLRDAPPRGTVCCHLPQVVLTPGRYHYSLWCEAENRRADQVEDAGWFDVVPADSTGTGQVPDSAKHGPVMVAHDWSLLAPGKVSPCAGANG